jgi:Mg2+ and Co2+ transporter CorA
MGAGYGRKTPPSPAELHLSRYSEPNEPPSYTDLNTIYHQPGAVEFDLSNRTARKILFEDVKTYADIRDNAEKHFVVFIYRPTQEVIANIREQFGLHPIFESECRNISMNVKSSLLKFDDHYLITFSDFSMSDNYEEQLSFKIVVFKSLLLIFSWDPLFCIDSAFKDELKSLTINSFLEGVERSVRRRRVRQQTISLYNIEVEIDDRYLPSIIDSYLYRILEATMLRLEKAVIRLSEETKQQLLYAMELSYYERVDFILRMSLSQKYLVCLEELVTPKISLFKKLYKADLTCEDMKHYLSCLLSRTESLSRKIKVSYKMIKSSKDLYESNVENALTINSDKLNSVMKHFSAIATIFLPLNLIAGLWGMNVLVPMQDIDSIYPFMIIVAVVLILGSATVLYFRNKNWL